MAPAVERPMPGSVHHASRGHAEISAVFVADDLRRAMQVARACVVTQARPQMQHLIGGRVGQRLRTSGKRAMNRSKYGMTVATCVCCSMISETQTRYGVRSLLPGQIVPAGLRVPGEQPGRDTPRASWFRLRTAAPGAGPAHRATAAASHLSSTMSSSVACSSSHDAVELELLESGRGQHERFAVRIRRREVARDVEASPRNANSPTAILPGAAFEVAGEMRVVQRQREGIARPHAPASKRQPAANCSLRNRGGIGGLGCIDAHRSEQLAQVEALLSILPASFGRSPSVPLHPAFGLEASELSENAGDVDGAEVLGDRGLRHHERERHACGREAVHVQHTGHSRVREGLHPARCRR